MRTVIDVMLILMVVIGATVFVIDVCARLERCERRIYDLELRAIREHSEQLSSGRLRDLSR
jgi:hypothetical protein